MLNQATQRVLRGAPATISVTWPDQDGEPAAPPGTVTVGVTRADGSDVVDAGTDTDDGATSAEKAYGLTAADTADLDLFTATWTAGSGPSAVTRTTTVEVVGGFYFTVDEARNEAKVLADAGKYSAADIIAARLEVEEECEDYVGAAFVPRFRRVELWGSGTARLRLPNRLIRGAPRSLSVDGTTVVSDVSGTVVATADGVLARALLPSINAASWELGGSGDGLPFAVGSRVTVAYEHGLNAPPRYLKRATIRRALSKLIADKSVIPTRALSLSNEFGNIAMAQPDPENDRPTGEPAIDAAYNQARATYNPRSGLTSIRVGVG